MDIRQLTPNYAVSPQIAPEDMATLAAEGYRVVINNRPDPEVSADLLSSAMQAAAEAAGLTYIENPVVNGAITMDMVVRQGEAVAQADGPVFAYCRSGTRSAIVWAMSQAGQIPTEALLTAAERGGYDLSGMAGQIDALAQK